MASRDTCTCAVTILLMCTGSLAPPNISPTRNYTVPTESTENVTYVCEADVGIVVWALNRRQIQSNADRAEYEARRIFIEETMGGNAMSTLTVTSQGRQALPQPIRVECYVFSDLNTESGGEYYIELFGELLVDYLLDSCQCFKNACSAFHAY